ncbi:BTB/POZ domain-containing protein At3g19850-like [Euphorbia lathyris]|uniref:BTB/POZ domain-containing protein At3g19850-like n=1 Tax=Euphorbia lathyris TaxID=212925 RepID=UPI003313F817
MSNHCDLSICINGEETFFLNQKIISRYSEKLKKMIKQEKLKVQISNFPGGPKGFEQVLRFCYNNGRIKITFSNICLLFCSAVFLEMKMNLLELTDSFLGGIFSWSWIEILETIKSCGRDDSILSFADSCGLLERLICGLLAKIAQNPGFNPGISGGSRIEVEDDKSLNSSVALGSGSPLDPSLARILGSFCSSSASPIQISSPKSSGRSRTEVEDRSLNSSVALGSGSGSGSPLDPSLARILGSFCSSSVSPIQNSSPKSSGGSRTEFRRVFHDSLNCINYGKMAPGSPLTKINGSCSSSSSSSSPRTAAMQFSSFPKISDGSSTELLHHVADDISSGINYSKMAPGSPFTKILASSSCSSSSSSPTKTATQFSSFPKITDGSRTKFQRVIHHVVDDTSCGINVGPGSPLAKILGSSSFSTSPSSPTTTAAIQFSSSPKISDRSRTKFQRVLHHVVDDTSCGINVGPGSPLAKLLGTSSPSFSSPKITDGSTTEFLHHVADDTSRSPLSKITGSSSYSSSSTSSSPTKTAAIQFSSSPKQWWFNDLSTLPPAIIEKLIRNLQSLGEENTSIILTRFILHYLKQKPPNTAYGSLADTAIYGVIFSGKSSFSCRGLLRMLKTLSGYGLSKSCRGKLERLIGGKLDETTLDDLLISGQEKGDFYDVNLILRLIRIFVNDNYGELMMGSIEKMKKVGGLIDKYMAEISPDHNLKMSKFLGVAESLPDSARDCFDGVYRAIDMFLQSHPTLTTEERSKVCKCLNYEKLSLEACKDLAKNPRIPPRIAIEALKCQSKSKEVVNGNFIEENEEMKMNIERMQKRVIELEKACKDMKGQMSLLVKHNNNHNNVIIIPTFSSPTRALTRLC